MATAAIISFEETRPAFAKTRARQQLHAQLDHWLDGLEAHMPENPPSLEELTQAVFAMRQQLTGKITEALIDQLHAPILQQRTMRCPDRHLLLPARPAPPRTVHTMVGEVSLVWLKITAVSTSLRRLRVGGYWIEQSRHASNLRNGHDPPPSRVKPSHVVGPPSQSKFRIMRDGGAIVQIEDFPQTWRVAGISRRAHT
jgi:hypothetical protein